MIFTLLNNLFRLLFIHYLGPIRGTKRNFSLSPPTYALSHSIIKFRHFEDNTPGEDMNLLNNDLPCFKHCSLNILNTTLNSY